LNKLGHKDQERLARLLWDKRQRAKETAQAKLREAKANRRPLTPELVALFGWLHFTDEEGRPLWPAAHHWLWLSLLCNRDIKKVFIVAPPESAKTTWILAYLGASIAFHPEWPRNMVAATGPTAEKRSLALRTLIESPTFRQTFPEIQRAAGLSYETSSWSVAPDGQPHPGRIHPTLAAYGARGNITGSRAMEAVGDDILDEENTRTAYMREAIEIWAHRSFFSRVKARRGRIIMIGTAWHHDDLYSHLYDNAGWTVCHLPLLSETNEVWATIRYADGYNGPKLGEPVAIGPGEIVGPDGNP